MADYTITVGGTDLCEELGATIYEFSEVLPEPKVHKVEIPAGLDLDITDSLGLVGYHNGKHVLRLLVAADDEAGRIEKVRLLVALLHGVMADYQLSWDEGYTYRGRFTVEVRRVTPRHSYVALTVDRSPWKVYARESVDLNAHPSASYALRGSKRYHDVRARLLQPGTTKIGSSSAVTRSGSGTYALAEEAYGDTQTAFTVSDWLMYASGTNLVVKESKFSTSGTDATIDAGYTVTDGNMVFPDEAKQHVTLYWNRYDL